MVRHYSAFPFAELKGYPVQIGSFSVIDYGGNVEFGKNVKVGYGVKILSVSTITGTKKVPLIRGPIKIGDNVEIGSNSVILPGVIIWNNSTIAACSVVNKNIPENCLAGGLPAKVIKYK